MDKTITWIMIGSFIFITFIIGLGFYINREEQVFPDSNNSYLSLTELMKKEKLIYLCDGDPMEVNGNKTNAHFETTINGTLIKLCAVCFDVNNETSTEENYNCDHIQIFPLNNTNT